jgi:hypothetical protein
MERKLNAKKTKIELTSSSNTNSNTNSIVSNSFFTFSFLSVISFLAGYQFKKMNG